MFTVDGTILAYPAVAIPQTASATDLGWAFFKKYAW